MSLFKQNDPKINSEYLLEMYQYLLNEEKDKQI